MLPYHTTFYDKVEGPWSSGLGKGTEDSVMAGTIYTWSTQIQLTFLHHLPHPSSELYTKLYAKNA